MPLGFGVAQTGGKSVLLGLYKLNIVVGGREGIKMLQGIIQYRQDNLAGAQ